MHADQSPARLGRASWCSSPQRQLATLLLGIVVSSVGVQPVTAQPDLAHEDELSVVWWTLTDQVTPDEMRFRHTDPDIQRERYLASAAMREVEADVEARFGLHAPSPEDLTYYFNPAEEPELTPFWLAFEGLSVKYTHSPEETLRRLDRSGVSKPGRIAVEAHVRRYIEESDRRASEIADDTRAWMALMKQALATEPDKAARGRMYDAWSAGDLTELSNRLDSEVVGQHDIQRLHAAWRENPMTGTAGVVLPQLRSSLDEADWSAFRRFLLTEVVPGIGSMMDLLPYN